MNRILQLIAAGVAALTLAFTVQAEDITKEQIKGLDEQVQEIKSDVLGIAAELSQLEEKLLYPSTTQVAVFLSLAGGDKLDLDSVEIELAGRPVAHHLYTFKEIEALRKGGVQRIYTGNIRTGEHEMRVTVVGSEGGEDFRQTGSFRVNKEVGPKMVEIELSNRNVTLKDW